MLRQGALWSSGAQRPPLLALETAGVPFLGPCRHQGGPKTRFWARFLHPNGPQRAKNHASQPLSLRGLFSWSGDVVSDGSVNCSAALFGDPMPMDLKICKCYPTICTTQVGICTPEPCMCATPGASKGPEKPPLVVFSSVLAAIRGRGIRISNGPRRP